MKWPESADPLVGIVAASLLHRMGETSITLTQADLQGDTFRLYEKITFEQDAKTGSVTLRLHPKPSNDPQLPLEAD